MDEVALRTLFSREGTYEASVLMRVSRAMGKFIAALRDHEVYVMDSGFEPLSVVSHEEPGPIGSQRFECTMKFYGVVRPHETVSQKEAVYETVSWWRD